MTTFRFPGDFRLTYSAAGGHAVTHYALGRWSGCGVNDDDRYHAARLGINPEEHRLQHELAHHIVGGLFGPAPVGGCPIIYRDAHGLPQPQPESDLLEWRITALQYHARGRSYDAGRIGALLDIERAGADPYRLGTLLETLLAVARLGVPEIAVPLAHPKEER